MGNCENKLINASNPSGGIFIGVWDTLNVKAQQFDISEWIEDFGEGTLSVLHQRRGDELPYEVADVVIENGIATWTFDDVDSAVVGEGSAALVYLVGDEHLARTVAIPTYTAPTVGMTGSEPPDPWESWYTRILEASAAAQQAASSAAASASIATSAAESAYTQAQQAAMARSQAVTARNEARSARDEAQAAQSLAETARDQARLYAEDAATAAGTATNAAETATTAAGGAVTAQGKAEDAQSAAETAQGKAEDAQAAAEAAAAQAEAHKYDAFATEGATAITRFRTILGADGIPTKTALVTQKSGTVPMDWTLRRCGKNQFDAANVLWKKGYNISTTGAETVNSSYAYTRPLIPVIPGARYVASGFKDRATGTPILAGTYCAMCYYDANGNFRARYGLYGANENPYFSTPSIANGDDYDCYFVRMYCNNGLISAETNKLASRVYVRDAPYDVLIQLEIMDNPAATAADATAYEPYSGVDYAVPVTALNTPTAPTETPTTALGQNVFSLFPTNLPAVGSSFSTTAEMDLRVRLDPTLVFDSLRGV